MPNSQLTGVRARTVTGGNSLLTGVRARTVPTGRSVLTGVRARTVNTFRSVLTGVRAQAIESAGPTAIVTGPAAVEPQDVFTLSLAGSSGGPFTGYQWVQISGPTATLTPSSATCSVVAPAAKPNAANWPNDLPLRMVFQGTVEKSGGAVAAAASLTVTLYPHTTWAADNSALFWHFA